MLLKYDEKIGHILDPLVAKYRPDLFARLRDIGEKQVPANLKPIVDYALGGFHGHANFRNQCYQLLSINLEGHITFLHLRYKKERDLRKEGRKEM